MMKKFIKIQEWFIDLNSIRAISEVMQIDADAFGIAYGFEVNVGGEVMPLIFADKNEAIFYRDELLKLLLMNSQIIDLDKLQNQIQNKGVKNGNDRN